MAIAQVLPAPHSLGRRRRRSGALGCRLQRTRAADLRAAHHAPEGSGVVDGEVLAAAIVPKGDRSLLPAEATGEFGAVAVLEQIVQQRPALVLRHSLEALRIGAVHIKQLAAG